MSGFSSLQDVEAVEGQGLPPDLPQSTYEMIRRGASVNPEAPALSFFLSVNDHRTPQTWSYAALLERITQTANFFDSIGVKKDSVIAFVLPNLPETHFVIWGGQRGPFKQRIERRRCVGAGHVGTVSRHRYLGQAAAALARHQEPAAPGAGQPGRPCACRGAMCRADTKERGAAIAWSGRRAWRSPGVGAHPRFQQRHPGAAW